MNESIINAARQHWSLGKAEISLIAARENHVYCVENGVKTALRLHRPGYRSLEQIRSELIWMDMLSRNNVCVPQPIRATDESLFMMAEGTVVSLLSWVDGIPFSQCNVDPQLYFELGKVLSQMHSLADSWETPKDFNRPEWDLVGESPTWDKFWKNPELTPSQSTEFIQFRDLARQQLASNKHYRQGLIHADLVPDNVLNNNNTLQLIDFDDGGFGYHLFDLATITHRSRRNRSQPKYAEAAIQGYCCDREICLDELAFFEALRACSYVGWNILRMNEANGLRRNTRFISEARNAIKPFL